MQRGLNIAARPLLGLALGLVIAIAGCGGSSTPTKAQYAEKAAAVCHTLLGEIKDVSENGHPVNQKVAELITIREHANAKLKSIPIPKGDTLAAEWLRARAHAVAVERKLTAVQNVLAPANRKLNAEYSAAFIRASRLGVNDKIKGCKGLAAA